MTPPLATDWAEVLVPPVWSATLLVALLVLAVVFRRPLGRVLAGLGISRLSVLGVDIEGITDDAEDAYRKRELEAPEREQLRAFAKLSGQLAPLARGRRLLWVDDEPRNNEPEARLLRKLGVDVLTALSTEEALERLRREPARFDLVVSDWSRGDEERAGADLLEALRTADSRLPVLMYVGWVDAARRAEAAELGALALTDEPDELLKLALVELAAAA